MVCCHLEVRGGFGIETLKPNYREVLKLVEWEEHPRNEVAALLNVSRAAIDRRVRWAYQQLERLLQHLPVPPGSGREGLRA